MLVSVGKQYIGVDVIKPVSIIIAACIGVGAIQPDWCTVFGCGILSAEVGNGPAEAPHVAPQSFWVML